MKNILRNNYSNFVRPCLNCPFNQSGPSQDGHSLCGFTKTGLQDSSCPLYAKWEKTKKSAYQIKMPVALENHSHEVFCMQDKFLDIDLARDKINKMMEKELSKKQFMVYDLLFIQHKDEEYVAKQMGYKTSEQGRKAGYKQIKNLKKIFKQKAQEIIQKEDILPENSPIKWT
jgi:hypothetical protein